MNRIIIGLALFIVYTDAFAAWTSGSTYCPITATPASFCGPSASGRAYRSVPTGVSCAGTYQQQRCEYWQNVSDPDPCVPPETWDQELMQCVNLEDICAEKTGDEAGIVENSPSPPGYELQCSGGCAVFASEFFQRTDNDNWVIAYQYTGQPCGPGDPLNEPDLPPGEEGPPAINPNQPSDTDDDGTPDSNDGDTDGDGIPNSTDTDDDGDGTSDADDPSPNGPGQQEQPSAANVALNCEQSPACTGDAIQCAQLVELWRLRCVGGGETEQVDEGLSSEIVDSVNQAGEQALDSVQSEVEDSLEDGSGVEMPDAFSNIFKGLFPSPSCADLSFNFKGSAFTISCAASADLRQFMAYLMFFTTAIYLYHLARKPVGE